jgi:hypothetical protein
MGNILDSLKEVLQELDQNNQPVTESELHRAIFTLRDVADTTEPPMEWLAEALTFEFNDRHQRKKTKKSQLNTTTPSLPLSSPLRGRGTKR